MLKMQFDKKVVYLGNKPLPLRDGTQLTSITFFEPDDQNTVTINVQPTNTAIMSVLPSISFGSPCNATFVLRDADKRNTYRLALVGLSPVKT